MSDTKAPIRLRTDSGSIDYSQPYWVLHRGKLRFRKTRDLLMVGGVPDTVYAYHTDEDLLNKLNSGSLFDFPYEPDEGDMLFIYNKQTTYCFLYSMKWVPHNHGQFNDQKCNVSSYMELWEKDRGYVQGVINPDNSKRVNYHPWTGHN
jgi:hypothetical protein